MSLMIQDVTTCDTDDDDDKPVVTARVVSFNDEPIVIESNRLHNAEETPSSELIEISLENAINSYNTHFDQAVINTRDRTRSISEDSSTFIGDYIENALCVLVVLIVLACIVYFGYQYSIIHENEEESEYNTTEY